MDTNATPEGSYNDIVPSQRPCIPEIYLGFDDFEIQIGEEKVFDPQVHNQCPV